MQASLFVKNYRKNMTIIFKFDLWLWSDLNDFENRLESIIFIMLH